MSKQVIGLLKKHSHSQDTVFLSSTFSTQVKNGEEITILYGQEKCKAKVVHLKQKEMIALSKNVWAKLSIPFSQTLNFYLKDNVLKIGPLVGLFTTGTSPDPHYPVGARTKLFKHFLKVQKDCHASYFVFGPGDISYTTRRVNGYFFQQYERGSKWRRCSVPFPNIVFDRIPNRTSERMESVVKGKAVLQRSGVKIFNPGFFNKWTIHQKINHRDEIQPYLPETIFKPRKDQLAALLKKHKMIYLKPSGGSLGLGIIQLFYQSNQKVLARYRGKSQNQLKRFSSISTALQYFFHSKSPNNYIAQQGIQLISLNDRSIDFRVHTNKNLEGKWQMTAVAAKIAGRGSVTTHMRSGGQVLPYQDVIKRCFPSQQHHSKVLSSLESAVLTLSQVIEESLPGYIGELGFDIGIDQSGHPWMFEANSKPGRHVFVHSSMKESDYITRKMILDYAIYLADFTPKEVTT
jgi:hypothetical protein